MSAVLVLANAVVDQLPETHSPVPFVEAWAAVAKVEVVRQVFDDQNDLSRLLRRFATGGPARVVCLAGHGEGGQPGSLGPGIDLPAALTSAFPRGAHRPRRRGLLTVGCEVDAAAVLAGTGSGLDWIAGCRRRVPWLVAVHQGLLFLHSLLVGGPTGDPDQVLSTISAETAASWVSADHRSLVEFGVTARPVVEP